MLTSERERLLYQIAKVQQLAEMVTGDPVMELPLRQQLEELNDELILANEKGPQPRAVLYFHGDPVKGSLGVESSFLSETLAPFQMMVSSRVSSMGKRVAKKGKIKNSQRSKLYLTSLPRGSFGVELKKLDNSDLFDGQEVTSSIKDVIELISASENKEDFLAKSTEASERELSALKKFFYVLQKNSAGITLDSDSAHVEFSKEAVARAYQVVSENTTSIDEIPIEGRLTGIYMQSRTFEFLTNTDQKITGNIHSDITSEELEGLVADFLDKDCAGIFLKKTTNQIDGDPKVQYSLISLSDRE